jgi:phage tail sheath protein FI
MAFQISPGVNISEIDLTTIVPSISTTVGAIGGHFHWGPVEKVVLVSTEDELIDNFGKPDANNATSVLTATSFLAYSNQLLVARAENSANNAATSGVGRYIKNDDDYAQNFEETGDAGSGNWAAKYPGEIGNSLKVSICPTEAAFSSAVSGANLVFNTTNNTVTTLGANVALQIVVGDYLYSSNSTVNFNIKVTDAVHSATSSTLTLEKIPTTVELGGAGLNANNVIKRWEFYDLFDGPPGTSDYAISRGGTNDELHVAIVDEDGDITTVRNNVIERYAFVSAALDAKAPQGGSNYYKQVINQSSPWVWWTGHDTSVTTADAKATVVFPNTSSNAVTESLSGGNNGTPTLTNSNRIEAYDLFLPDSEIDVSILMAGDSDAVVSSHLIQNIAEVRKDLVVTLSPERTDVVNNNAFSTAEQEDVIEFRNTLPSSSYGIMDSGWKYMYDKYNDTYRYVPLNGDIAGLMVITDSIRDPWFSPAGFNRGSIKNIVRLAFNPAKAERDQLYKNGINPVVAFPGQGTVLFGDKTLLTKPSAFDRINVRRLFIVLEKAISRAAQYSLFEFNDDFTRAQFRNLIEPFLRDVQGRRGIFDFRVVCDTTNNTPEIIDRNEFVGSIYVKPARSINFIQLNFIAVRTGVEFDEVVGSF